jgi:REP element-mobilizing transposase RayT
MNNLKNRKSIRLSTYNYKKNGSYFITICIQNRENRLGKIKNGNMILNQAGEMIDKWLNYLSEHFKNISITDRVIMPNHIHFILNIQHQTEDLATLSTMIQWFKTMTTNEYIRGVKDNIYLPFNKRIWQRNYYEHIIRNEKSFLQIEQYIQNNPRLWQEDILYMNE